jgi:hypothetical protein
MPRRLVLFDRTQGALTRAWAAGRHLYRGLGRLDGAIGAASWAEALDGALDGNEAIAELQFWGHGKWGAALFDRDVLDASALRRAHPLHDRLVALRACLAPGALVWLRCCESFGAARGHDLARRLADFLGARVAGHTFVIGFHQSGLHGLAPGASPDWPADEGLAEGTADAPVRALPSRPWRPHTVTCLARAVPAAWFAA